MASSTSSDSSREVSRPNVKPESTGPGREKSKRAPSFLGSPFPNISVASFRNQWPVQRHSSRYTSSSHESSPSADPRTLFLFNWLPGRGHSTRYTPASPRSASDSSHASSVRNRGSGRGNSSSYSPSSPRSLSSDSSHASSVRNRGSGRRHKNRHASSLDAQSFGTSYSASSSATFSASSDNYQFVCPHCRVVFNDNDALVAHNWNRELNNGACVARAPAPAFGAEAARVHPIPSVSRVMAAAEGGLNDAVGGQPVGAFPFVCRHCSIAFADRTMFCLHMNLHSVTNPWQCNKCGKVCSGRHEFASHALHY